MVDFVTADFEKILEVNQYESNILEYYDNVTYNIRFYMLNHTFQKRYSRERLEGVNFIVPDNEKIIIVETGISSNYNVSSLQIQAVHASAEKNPSSATFNMDLRIHEVGGCSLVNKITAVSKAVGYESYIHQPFHIDIWFSGYEQATGKPIQVIEDKVLTYEVIVNEVTTSIDNTGCMYDFHMTPQSSLDKNVNTLFKIGEIQPGWEGNSGGNTFGAYVDRIVELINKKYMEENPSIAEFYQTEGNEYLTIRDYKSGNNTSYDAIVKNAIKKYNREKELNYKSNQTNKLSIQQTQINDIPQTTYIPLAQNIDINHINTIDFKNCTIDPFIAPQNQDSVSKGLVQFESLSTFEQALQELCFHSTELASYVVRPKYYVEYIKNTNGIECKKISADLIFTENLYLRYFKERALDNDFSYEKEQERIKNMQLDEAKNLVLNDLLQKRYEWMYNGRDTSVLEFNTSIDKLWYANTGIDNYVTVNAASKDIVKEYNNIDNQFKLISIYEESMMDKKKRIDEVLRETNKPLDGVRGLASDKRLYLDDIFNCFDDDTLIKYLSNRKIYEKNDSLSNADNNNSSESSEKVSIMTKAGYNNIHSNNLVEIELLILGDMFWLGLFEDKKLYDFDDTNDFNKFHHFAFRVKTPISIGEEGTWKLQDSIEFSSIYQIVESTSILEDGKFVQKIKGVLDPAFMHLARIKGI